MPTIAFLDLNKWIEIARAIHRPDAPVEHKEIVHRLAKLVEAGEIILPLSLSNIIETQKIGDDQRRMKLAEVICSFSKGLIFRPRTQLFPEQLKDFYYSTLSLGTANTKANWFICSTLPEALSGRGDIDKALERSEVIFKALGTDTLFDYLASGSRVAELKVKQIRNSALISKIESRRASWKHETVDQRRRAYSAILFYQDQDTIIDTLEEVGGDIDLLRQNDGELMRRLVDEVPSLYVDRELALKIEAEDRGITGNDLYDFMSFSTVLPFAHIVIGEKASISRMKQARLDRKFSARLATSLTALVE